MLMQGFPPQQGLYDPAYEHDACGVGFICHIKGKASHKIVSDALLMVRTPDKFFRKEAVKLGIKLPPERQYAVGMVFLPQEMVSRHQCEQMLEKVVRDYGMLVLGWRDVPVDSRHAGPTPRKSEPRIRQIFVGMGETFFNRADFDRRLYLVRQRAENIIEFSPDLPKQAREDFYVCILSANRMIYKGMLTAEQLRHYYRDLSDPDFQSAFAVVHSRFSTNTFPAWWLAHPYRYLAHNGEINTLRGNRNWMRARSGSMQSEVFGDELAKMYPIITESGSDSATLDNEMQFLVVNGRTLPHAVLMLIPEAWQNNSLMDPELRAFYEYHACLMEPWDGPASIVFSNGEMIGAVLDRNG